MHARRKLKSESTSRVWKLGQKKKLFVQFIHGKIGPDNKSLNEGKTALVDISLQESIVDSVTNNVDQLFGG